MQLPNARPPAAAAPAAPPPTLPGPTPLSLPTADGVRLAGVLHSGPGSVCLVLAHGFGVSTRHAAVRRVAAELARHCSVLAYDARGHGRSGGRTTLGDREVHDVDAAVRRARALGFRRVVTCGWSMGGAAVVRQAGLLGVEVGGLRLSASPDAVVSVSATSAWSRRETAQGPLRRLHWLVETSAGRGCARTLMRTRVARSGWDPPPAAPVDVVHRIAPRPLLVVHGDRDGYFPLHHPQALAGAAREPVDLWVEPGFGHAEAAAGTDLLDRLGRRVLELAA